MNPKISIIIPTYNSASIIENCINSILNQTYKNMEIIIIDDGSTDNTKNHLKKYESLKQVKLLYQENSGVSVSRNKGIEISTGEYITFLDSDDYYEKNHIQNLVDSINKTNSDIAISLYFIFTKNEIIKPKLLEINEDITYSFKDIYHLLKKNNLLNQPWNKLYKKEMIKKFFDKDISIGEDVDFILKNIDSNTKFSFVNKPSYYYNRGMDNSLTSNYKLYFDTFQKETEKIQIYLNSLGITNEFIARQYAVRELWNYLFEDFITKNNLKERYLYLSSNKQLLSYLKQMKKIDKKCYLYSSILRTKSYALVKFSMYLLKLLKSKS